MIFFILKLLLDQVVEELMCPQMKFSKPVSQHVTANETVLAMPANETYPLCYNSSLAGKSSASPKAQPRYDCDFTPCNSYCLQFGRTMTLGPKLLGK
jgi:hypothetical protein